MLDAGMYRTYQAKPIQYLWKCKKYNLDIIALSETKKKVFSKEVLGNYVYLWSSVD
jgi:hypothetical protein